MAKIATSFADIVHDWELLLQAANDNESVKTGARVQREALEEILAALRASKATQDSCAAQRQQATQQVNQRIDEGREMARRLRGAVKAILGTRNERLVQFRVAPIRGRRRRVTSRNETAVSSVEPVARE